MILTSRRPRTPPIGRRRTSRAGLTRSRRRCSTARSTWPCTRPRTCQASWLTGWRCSARPARADARDALCGVSASRRWPGGARGHRQRAARRPAARRAPGSGGRPAARQRRHPPAHACTRAASTRSCSRSPACCASGGPRRGGAPRWTADTSSRRPARASWRCRARGGDERACARGRAISDAGASAPLLAPSARWCARWSATCHTPVGAHAQLGGAGGTLELSAFVGLPDGSAWAARSAARAARPEALGAEVAQRLLAAGAGELLGELKRWPSTPEAEPRPAAACISSAPGPGDPGLLTARALELIATADVILHDRLIPPRRLDGARADAELLFVGKEGGGASVPQEETEALMVERARAGARGGAPEGRRSVRVRPRRRGGPDAARGRASPSRWCPASPPGVAAPAYAGIPVTHRDHASAVALVTGHEDPDKAADGARLERAGRLSRHARVLHGRAPARAHRVVADRRRTPARRAGGGGRARHAARPAHGRWPRWQTIAERGPEAGIGPPAVTVVGDVAALARELAWLPSRPLSGAHGRRHPRARPGQRAGRAPGRAGSAGGRGARDRDPAAAGRPVPDLVAYDLVCLTSPNGVGLLFERLARGGRTRARWPARAWPRSAPARRARLSAHGRDRRHRARALRGRGAGRGAGRRSRAPRPDRARARGARRAARRPARSAAPRSTCSRSTRRCRAAGRAHAGGGARGRLHHLHRRPRRSASSWRPPASDAGLSGRPGSCRSAR